MTTFTAARYRSEHGCQVALARLGRTRLHLTLIDDQVTHRVVPRDEERYLTPLKYHGREYTVERLVRQLRRIGRERGVTAAAKRELQLAGA